MVWLHNVPWGAENTKAAPDAKVKAFILEPGPRLGDQKKEGIIDVDGEVLARGKGSYQCEQKALMMTDDKLQITVDQETADFSVTRMRMILQYVRLVDEINAEKEEYKRMIEKRNELIVAIALHQRAPSLPDAA